MAVDDVVLISIILFENEDGLVCAAEAHSVLGKNDNLATLGKYISQQIDELVLTPINESVNAQSEEEEEEDDGTPPIFH